MNNLNFEKTESFAWRLDDELVRSGDETLLTVGQSFEGTCIFGGTGSGKTSGSGATYAKALLRKGFGGCVLTAKVDERILWEKYARETGRDKDVVVISDADYSDSINLLQYELSQMGGSSSANSEVANILLEATSLDSKPGNAKDPFWENSVYNLLYNGIVLLTLSQDYLERNNKSSPEKNGGLKLAQLINLIHSAPREPKEQEPTTPKSEELEKSNTLNESDKKGKSKDACPRRKRPNQSNEIEHNGKESPSFFETTLKSVKKGRDAKIWKFDQDKEAERAIRYFTKEFVNMNPSTRSDVLATFDGQISWLLTPPFRRIFFEKNTIAPSDSYRKCKIFIVDIPIKKYPSVGRMAQILFKLIWQRSMERRGDEKGAPVFLWIDEAQFFVSPNDISFLTTARSSKVATVFLTQTIVNYRTFLDRTNGEGNATDNLLSLFQTKIFHANECPVTKEYTQRLFGVCKRRRLTEQRSREHGKLAQVTFHSQTSTEYVLPANKFNFLKRGGAPNDNIVEAYVFQTGRKWKKNPYYLKAVFHQDDDQ